jgi:hypothetical protein
VQEHAVPLSKDAKRWKWYLMVWLVLLALLLLVLRACGDVPPDDVYVGKPLYSPDKKYMAVLFSEAGGGGISPYCIDTVSVAPATVTPSKAYAKKFHVYEGGCHSLGFTKRPGLPPALENAPALKWSGQHDLEITFDPKQAAHNVRQVLFVDQADDGRVKIVQKLFKN